MESTTAQQTNGNMDALFRPKSVAMVGVSEDASKIGYRVVRNMLDQNYPGDIFLINPRGGTILDRPVLKDAKALPHGVDLAFLAVPMRAACQALKGCIEREVKFVVALTAGFKETGPEGERLQRELSDLVRASATRLVGPNCAGLCNTWGDFHGSIEIYPHRGDISLISQSGSLCSALSSNLAVRSSGISKYISVGNKADVNVADLLAYLGQDPTTRCIALYLEDISDARRFRDVAFQVSRKKPVVILKSGRTAAGARATASHTGALAGQDAVANGAFLQTGAIRVHTLTQLYDVTAALSKTGPLFGKRLAVLSDAGGPGVLATDAAVEQGLEVPPTSPKAREDLRALLADFASVRNPVDMTFTRDANQYARCVEVLYRDHMNGILITIPSHFSVKEDIVSALGGVRKDLGLPMAVAWLSADEVEQARRDLWQKGIPAFLSPEPAVYALERLAWYGAWLKRRGMAWAERDPEPGKSSR